MSKVSNNFSMLPPAIFLMGPTASGKTNAAIHLLSKLPVEIISVDSALVFNDMDIGTAKPDAKTLAVAPHHLINITPPTHAYSAANFSSDAKHLMADITQRGKVPLLVGGTMLYFKALEEGLSGLPEANAEIREEIDQEANELGWPAMHKKLFDIDPITAARLAPKDAQRIQRALEVYAISGMTMSALFKAQTQSLFPYQLLKIALLPNDRQVLHSRIATRFKGMLAEGLLDEVRQLLIKYPTLTPDTTSMRCVGYRQSLDYLAGEYDSASQHKDLELLERGIFATRQLAKRQLTWLRNMPDVTAFDCLESALHCQIESHVIKHLNNHSI
jgi:tRNA dimethylallyltransferase